MERKSVFGERAREGNPQQDLSKSFKEKPKGSRLLPPTEMKELKKIGGSALDGGSSGVFQRHEKKKKK